MIGAFVVMLLPEALRFAAEYRMLIFALLLIVLMGLGQNGIAGLCVSAARAVSRRASFDPGRLERRELAE